jgi:hypothetical protein
MCQFVNRRVVQGGVAALLVCGAVQAKGESPYATQVVSYTAGTGINPSYTDPNAALGSPARVNGSSFGDPTAVNPFNSPFESFDVVSIGRGGSLTIGFDHDVHNDAGNPYGIDLLIFGNAFISTFGSGGFFAEGGDIAVSLDGIAWTTVTGRGPNGGGQGADAGFPTLGFTDITDPFSSPAGSVPTDFTKPVDPNFNPFGKSLSEIIAGYDGSGGGLGIDIGAFGLDAIRFVRVSSSLTAIDTPDIDGFSDVAAIPAPASAIALLAIPFVSRRRRESGL